VTTTTSVPATGPRDRSREVLHEVVGAWCELDADDREEITDRAPRLGQILERLSG